MSGRDYYSILGITEEATEEVIRKTYKKMALDNHPDRNPGNQEAERKFKEATEAYTVLNDPSKRAAYDKQRKPYVGFQYVTGDFFAGVGNATRNRPNVVDPTVEFNRPGLDINIILSITLEEVATGCSKLISATSQSIDSICEVCAGTGAAPNTRTVVCALCAGKGKLPDFRMGIGPRLKTCPSCKGRGTRPLIECMECKGIGRVRKKREVNLKVPPGIESGQTLRLAGFGSPGSPPGDLYVEIHVQPHNKFERRNQNLYVVLRIQLVEAMLGTSVTLSSINDKPLSITIPPGVQQLQEVIVRGEGLPSVLGQARGDLHVVIHVQIPKITDKMTPRAQLLLKELMQELAASNIASNIGVIS